MNGALGVFDEVFDWRRWQSLDHGDCPRMHDEACVGTTACGGQLHQEPADGRWRRWAFGHEFAAEAIALMPACGTSIGANPRHHQCQRDRVPVRSAA